MKGTVVTMSLKSGVKNSPSGKISKIFSTALSAIRERMNGKWYLALCFAVPAGIMLIMYMCMGVNPFDEGSVLILDMNAQYVYFFEQIRDVLRGETSILYTFERALGGEFMGMFAYYLASPFSLIVALFPEGMITESLLVMMLLKCGACGLTFGIYIEKTRKRNPAATVMFSVMYALCAYAVVMQHNTMWTDNLIFLPLVLLGVERLIKYGRFRLFIISLAWCVFSNFYIGYMMCIFVAIYFFYYWFATAPEERNPLGINRHFLKSFAKILVCSLIALAICAVIILPTYYSLGFGKNDFSNPNFTFDQKNDFLDMATKLFFGSYDTVRPEGMPFLYTGMITLLLVPAYFFMKKIRLRERLCSAVLIVVFLLSFNSTTIDLVWHGFQRPNWLNYRYAFILAFFLLLFAYKAYENIREINPAVIMSTGAVIALCLMVIQKYDFENMPDLTAIWVSLALTVVYMGALRAAAHPSVDIRKTAASVLTVIVIGEAVCAGLINMIDLDEDVIYSSRTSYYDDFMDKWSPAVQRVLEEDESFYRMEKTKHRKTNDNMALDIRGVSNSTSTLNQSVINLLNRLGLAAKAHWTKYLGSTPVFDSLFGIKYVLTEKSADTLPLYNKVFTEGIVTAMENPYALPIAYTADSSITNLNIALDSYNSPFERMNDLVGALTGSGDNFSVFRPIEYSNYTVTGGSQASADGHIKVTAPAEGKAVIEFTLTAAADGPLYAYFPSSYQREADLSVNGAAAGTYYGNETYRIVDLGSFKAGDTVKVCLSPKEENLYIKKGMPYFYYMDEKLFEYAMTKLSAGGLNIEMYSDTQFHGTVTASDDQVMFTTIPYDEGWHIYVDGERVETKKALDSLIYFDISEGEHTIVMKYRPVCVTAGVIISVAGLAVFITIWIIDRKKRIAVTSVGSGKITALKTKRVSKRKDSDASEIITEQSSDFGFDENSIAEKDSKDINNKDNNNIGESK